MDCREFMRLVHEHFTGEASAEQSEALRAHADVCPTCGPTFRTAEEMACSEFVEFLDDYLDGNLPDSQRATFERHLGVCTDCVAYLDSYRKTKAMGAQALRCDQYEERPLPSALKQAILDARASDS